MYVIKLIEMCYVMERICKNEKSLIITIICVIILGCNSKGKENNNEINILDSNYQVEKNIFEDTFIEKSKIMDEPDILHTPNKEQFEAIVQFVLDNGGDASLSKDDRLTPMVRYKKMLVYIIPNSYTEQRKNVNYYNHIIIFGPDAAPAYNKGPRFDIYKGKNNVYIKEKTIHSKDTINAYMSMLKEMVEIKRIVEDMDKIVSKELFESIVQFILDNGEEVLYSSLWGVSPSIIYKDISIYLIPNLNYINMENVEKNVSYYTGMTVFFDAEGGNMFNIGIKDNGGTYLYVENCSNKILYENEIASTFIPLLKKMIKK